MKKLVLGVALSLVGFSAINAAELKCDSIEAKKAFVKTQLNLSDSEAKKLPSKDGFDNKFTKNYSDSGFTSVWFNKGVLNMQSGDNERGATYEYSNFKLVKNNKNSVLCSAKWVAVESDGGDNNGESKFTLQQDSKGNLVAKEVN